MIDNEQARHCARLHTRHVCARVNPSSPAIARRARRYAMKLGRALAIAGKRDSRKSPLIASLYTTATVEGLAAQLNMRKAAVCFKGKPLRGSVHYIFDWHSLDELSDRELAADLAWS